MVCSPVVTGLSVMLCITIALAAAATTVMCVRVFRQGRGGCECGETGCPFHDE